MIDDHFYEKFKIFEKKMLRNVTNDRNRIEKEHLSNDRRKRRFQ